MREVIDIQAVKDCLAEVEDCEDKQYALALLEWAIGKRTFDLAKHDAELLDKVAEELKAQFKDMQFHTGRAWFDFDAGIDRCSEKVDKVIAEMKAEVSK